MSTSCDRIRMHYQFFGRVQGVGFRYRARYAADSMRLTGWVRNCWDGSVEMEIQGTESEILKVITMIRQSDYIEIQDTRVKKIPVDTSESGFHVRH